MFDSMYRPYASESITFGKYWTDPEKYLHGEDVLCARYEASGDGHPVEVYCCAMPARFYTIKVLPGPNSCGEMRSGWQLGTGSGMDCARLAHEIASAVAEGMLDLDGAKQSN